jgi:hypothetical protein
LMEAWETPLMIDQGYLYLIRLFRYWRCNPANGFKKTMA